MGEVPDGLLTEDTWAARYRKIKKDARPGAGLKDADSEFYHHPLYSFEVTRPLTRKQWAVEYLWRLFVASHNGDRHIRYAEDAGGWVTVHKNSRLLRFEAPYLRRADLEAHLAHRKTFGVFGGRLTRWLAIDLDLHDRKTTPLTPERRAVFVEMLAALLQTFHGDGWHVQVADRDAGGVHLIQVLAGAVPLETEVLLLRDRLRVLDSRHPDLAARAAAHGMKTFSKIEVYPDPKNGFRLPLGRGRTLLLDRPLLAVNNARGRPVGDVIGYAAWLEDATRQYMSPVETYQYVVERLQAASADCVTTHRPICQKAPTGAAPAKSPINNPGPVKLPPMRGQFRRHLVEYWTGRATPPGVLNPWIKMLARCLRYEVDEYRAVEVIERYCDELPDKSVSSRLTNDRREVSRYISAVVRAVYHGDGYQPDPEMSAVKMRKAVAAWHARGFVVADKSTWTTGGSMPADAAFEWSAEETKYIEEHFLPILKLKIRDVTSTKTRPPRDHAAELHVARGLLKEIVLTAYRYRDGEVAYTLLDAIFERHGVSTGSGGMKRTRLMRKLDAEGWVTVRTAPWAKKRPTGYQIGSKLQYKFSQVQEGGRASISSTTFPHPEVVDPATADLLAETRLIA